MKTAADAWLEVDWLSEQANIPEWLRNGLAKQVVDRDVDA